MFKGYYYYAIRNLINRIRRAIAYGVHGFSSEDWDYNYLLKDIRFKVLRMSKEAHKDADIISEDTIKDFTDHCGYIVGYIDNELNDVYLSEVRKHIKKIDMIEKGLDKNGYTKIDLKVTYVDPKMTKAKYTKILTKATERKDLNLKILFDYLNENLRNLWT